MYHIISIITTIIVCDKHDLNLNDLMMFVFSFNIIIMTQWWGSLALILADSKTLPLDYEMYAFELGLYTTSLEDRIRDANVTNKIDTSPLRDAVNTLSIISADVRASYDRVEDLSWFQLREYNDRLLLAERSFLLPDGLDGKADDV